MTRDANKSAAAGDTEQVNWRVTGLDCPSCAAALEAAVAALDGVSEAEVSFASGTIRVVYDPLRAAAEQIAASIRLAGHDVELPEGGPAAPPGPVAAWRWARRNRRLIATMASLALLLSAAACDWLAAGAGRLHVALYLGSTAVGGFYVARAAALSALRRRVDMNVLMTIAVIGALAIGYWSEAATVTFLFALSLWLEERAMDRARHAIRSLLKLKPDRVRVVGDDGPERLEPPDRVAVGQRMQVRPAERIGLDGVIVAGEGGVDQSAVTGESAPVPKAVGDEVLAGTINLEATLTVRVTRPVGQSTLARIIHLVEQAQATRAPAQRFVDRFARVYTPLVVAAAVLVAIVPPMLLGQPFLDRDVQPGQHGWLYRALVLLVTACPCALVISTPVSVVSALASAARRGVLIKGGAHLETLARVHCVVFDKTGTLTSGQAAVTDVIALAGMPSEDLLRLAAALESHSEHPAARAILARARDAAIDWPEPAQIKVLPGRGVAGRIDGADYWLGNQRLARERGADLERFDGRIRELELAGKTLVLIGRGQARDEGRGAKDEGEVLGLIAIADQVRPSAGPAMALLRQASRDLRGRGGARVETDQHEWASGRIGEGATDPRGDAKTPGRRDTETAGQGSFSRTTEGRRVPAGPGAVSRTQSQPPFSRDTKGRASGPEREGQHIDAPPHRAHLVMLTGDNRFTARAIAEQLGIDSYAAELLPAEKVAQVRRLAFDCTGAVAMVGDGINDAPALAAADLGIAMGAAGTDAALQTADVALIGDDLAGVPFAVRLGRRTRAAIAQNVWFAIGVKAAVLTLAVAGLANLWMAVLADMGASLLVTANGLRLLWVNR